MHKRPLRVEPTSTIIVAANIAKSGENAKQNTTVTKVISSNPNDS